MNYLTRLLKRLVFALPEVLVIPLRKARALAVTRGFSEDEEPDLRVVAHLVAPGDTVLDIGANIGCYTRYLSERVGPSGRVYSVEPVPTTFEILSAVVRKLELANVKLCNCAVSDTEGRATMEVPRYETGGMNLYQARISVAGGRSSLTRFDVSMQTIDSLFAEVPASISFVKVDVEGFELACLNGARRTLARAHPAWLIEVSGDPDDPASDARRLFDLLSSEGYAAFWYDGTRLHRRSRGDRSINYFFLIETQIGSLERHFTIS